jgi:hypothetical protein
MLVPSARVPLMLKFVLVAACRGAPWYVTIPAYVQPN